VSFGFGILHAKNMNVLSEQSETGSNFGSFLFARNLGFIPYLIG